MGLEPITGSEAEDIEVFANGERQKNISVSDGDQINLGNLPFDIDIEGQNIEVGPDDSVSLTTAVEDVVVSRYTEQDNRNGVYVSESDCDFTQDEIEEADTIEFRVVGIERNSLSSSLWVDGSSIDSDTYETIEYQRELGDSLMDFVGSGNKVTISLSKEETVVDSVDID